MRNAGSPDVETRTVGTRLMYFMSVLAHFTIFPLGDFLHIFTEIAASTVHVYYKDKSRRERQKKNRQRKREQYRETERKIGSTKKRQSAIQKDKEPELQSKREIERGRLKEIK